MVSADVTQGSTDSASWYCPKGKVEEDEAERPDEQNGDGEDEPLADGLEGHDALDVLEALCDARRHGALPGRSLPDVSSERHTHYCSPCRGAALLQSGSDCRRAWQADVHLQAPRPYPKSRLPSEARTVPRLAKYVTSR